MGRVEFQSRPVKDIVPLARLKLVRVPFALYGLPMQGLSLPQANFLRATEPRAARPRNRGTGLWCRLPAGPQAAPW